MRGDLAAAEMSVAMTPPQEAQLDLVIEDGNNPPLELTGIEAVFAYLPWIYFESTDEQPLTARYGYPDLEEPRYDLEAAREFAAKARTVEARWEEKGPVRVEAESRTGYEVPMTGASIDLGGFRYARSIAAGKPGLSALPLDAAVLAHSSIGDLRIAGADGKQIPYLVEKADEPLSLDLPPLEIISGAAVQGIQHEERDRHAELLSPPPSLRQPARSAVDSHNFRARFSAPFLRC